METPRLCLFFIWHIRRLWHWQHRTIELCCRRPKQHIWPAKIRLRPHTYGIRRRRCTGRHKTHWRCSR